MKGVLEAAAWRGRRDGQLLGGAIGAVASGAVYVGHCTNSTSVGTRPAELLCCRLQFGYVGSWLRTWQLLQSASLILGTGTATAGCCDVP